MTSVTYIIYDYKRKKSYVGSTTLKQWEKGYMGSTTSGRFHKAKKSRPNSFGRRILRYYDTRDAAYKAEQVILDRYFDVADGRVSNLSPKAYGAPIGNTRMLGKKHKDSTKKLQSIKRTEYLRDNPDSVRERNNGRYDHTLYKWRHKDGMEEVKTKHDMQIKYGIHHSNMARGIREPHRSCRGWYFVGIA